MPFDFSPQTPLSEGARRRLVLADFLETEVPSPLFDMRQWVGIPGCALYWAAQVPEFKAASYACELQPTFNGLTAFGAATAFFGMPRLWAAHELFSGTFHIGETPQQMAAHLRASVMPEVLS